MAAITSTTVLIDRAHGNSGVRFLRIRYTWDNGDSMTLDSVVDAQHDVNAWISARISELEPAAVLAELDAVLSK